MLVLLRGRLADSDASSDDPRLVLTREDLVEMVRGFLPPRGNEAQLVDQIDYIKACLHLGAAPCA
ncbi:hypothetical protein [Streptomyces sp. Mo3]|uniref:hypothetical protein n=1 Tax=Streptomyces sp. Mo3 TaxID=3161190 RepID=UPI0039EFF5D7